jgi:hypothetical protein
LIDSGVTSKVPSFIPRHIGQDAVHHIIVAVVKFLAKEDISRCAETRVAVSPYSWGEPKDTFLEDVNKLDVVAPDRKSNKGCVTFDITQLIVWVLLIRKVRCDIAGASFECKFWLLTTWTVWAWYFCICLQL